MAIPSDIVRFRDPNFDQKAISDYWTEERMRNAIPIDLPHSLPKAGSNRTLWQEGQKTSSEASIRPNGQPAAPASQPTLDDGTDYDTSLVPNSDYSDIPYSPVGKMYMTFGGSNFVGTAWAIAGSETGFFTAGHCVYTHKEGLVGWATNVMVKAQYNNNNDDGVWYGEHLTTLQGWIDEEGYEYDMAGIISTASTDSIGRLGYLSNVNPDQGVITAIGYPAEIVSGYNFNGQQMWQSVGDYISGTDNMKMYNNMTGGCSGGPWVINSGGILYAYGLNSHRHKSDPNTLFSPYFGDDFKSIYSVLAAN